MEIELVRKDKINELAVLAVLIKPGEQAPPAMVRFTQLVVCKCLDLMECEDAGLLESGHDAIEEMLGRDPNVWVAPWAQLAGWTNKDEEPGPAIRYYMHLVVQRCLELIRREAPGDVKDAYKAIATEFGAVSTEESTDVDWACGFELRNALQPSAPLRQLAKDTFYTAKAHQLGEIEAAAAAYQRWEQGQVSAEWRPA
nr:hypothetical protein [uncultured Albidiferax sp.]